MQVGVWCQRCEDEIESDCHHLFECDDVEKFWVESPLWHLRDTCRELDFPSILLAAKDQLQNIEFELFTVYLWIIWHGRNESIMGEMEVDGPESIGIHNFEQAKKNSLMTLEWLPLKFQLLGSIQDTAHVGQDGSLLWQGAGK